MCERRFTGVTFDVGLIDDVEAKFITQVKQSMIVWIVSRSDCVDVVLFHEHQFFSHLVNGHRFPIDGVVVVSIDSENFDGRAVDFDSTVLHLDTSEPGYDGVHFNSCVIGTDEFCNDAVPSWRFCRPWLCRTNLDSL